jgi:hypothetical protein
MERYIAVIRLTENPSRQYLATAVAGSLTAMAGVSRVEFDTPGRSLLVWFNRARVSLGELVRTIEGQGLTVCGVAQSRDPAGAAGARAASA